MTKSFILHPPFLRQPDEPRHPPFWYRGMVVEDLPMHYRFIATRKAGAVYAFEYEPVEGETAHYPSKVGHNYLFLGAPSFCPDWKSSCQRIDSLRQVEQENPIPETNNVCQVTANYTNPLPTVDLFGSTFHMPEGYRYLAADADGEIYAYRDKPVAYVDWWVCYEPSMSAPQLIGRINGEFDWMSTLRSIE